MSARLADRESVDRWRAYLAHVDAVRVRVSLVAMQAGDPALDAMAAGSRGPLARLVAREEQARRWSLR